MKSFISMMLIFSILSPMAQAQSQKSKVGMGVAAVGATGTFLKLRKETLYKSSVVREISDAEMQHMASKLGADEKLVIKQRNQFGTLFINKHKKIRVSSANPAILGEYLGKYKGDPVYSVKSVKRVSNKISLKSLKKANPFTLLLTTMAIGGSVYSIFNWNAGKNDEAAGRFNGPREIESQTIELTKRVPSGKKSQKSRKQ